MPKEHALKGAKGAILVEKYDFSDRWEMITAQRKDWHGLNGLHPESILAIDECEAFGRQDIICPYCGTVTDPEPEDYNTDGDRYDCYECGRAFLIEASFGYGFTSKPIDCNERGYPHKFVFNAQYFYQDKDDPTDQGHTVRIIECINCDKTSYQKGDYTLLPWRDEYNDPDYFDPDGSLKPAPDWRPKPTPVLDYLRECERRYAPARKPGGGLLTHALMQHDKHYNTFSEVD